MRQTYITLLAACGGAIAGIALKPDRSAVRPRLAPTSQIVAEPSSDVRAIAERLNKKDRLIDRLIVGHLHLAEAAETVIALNREWPPLAPEFYETYSGPSLAAREAHMLVGAVECRVAVDDPRRDEILRRLIRELREVIAAQGHSVPD